MLASLLPASSPAVLVCFDWDGTISVGNSHNAAYGAGIEGATTHKTLVVNGMPTNFEFFNPQYDQLEVIEFARAYYNDREASFNQADKVLSTINKLTELQVNIAIVSYNNYPEIIEVGLERIGLSAEEIKKIQIICGFPSKDIQVIGKLEHIDVAKKSYNITPKSNKDVILVEDSIENIRIAQENKIKCIYVATDNDFLDELLTFINDTYCLP